MPRKFLFTREDIIAAALALTRDGGIAAVTARALGEKLGASSKPIFSLFPNMEAVQKATLDAADALYQGYSKADMQGGLYPPYKASGMAYIRFAREEKELFRLLFMRDRSHEDIAQGTEAIQPLIEIIRQNTDLSEADATMLHLEMWIFVHGIATMTATAYAQWDIDLISNMLTDAYEGFKHRHCEGMQK